MSNGIPLSEAVILSSSLESTLYGASVCMFGATLWILTSRPSTAGGSRPMIAAACLLFLFSTMHTSIDIYRLITAFVRVGKTNPAGIEKWLGAVSQKSYVLKSAIYILQTLTGDAVVIYRCYKVYRSIWIILAPCILWCSMVSAGVGILHTFTHTGTDVFAHKTTIWVSSFWATTLATNLTGTVMLAHRIWRIDRNVAQSRTASSLKGVLHMILDAGAIYSITLLSALIPFILKSEGQYVVLDMITPIISIAFYMVLIRVGLSRTGSPTGIIRPSASTGRSVASTKQELRNTFPMKPVEVHIARLTETDRTHAVRSDSSVLDKSV